MNPSAAPSSCPDKSVARLYAARARREATQLNRMGRCDEAASLLERVRQRIESTRGTTPSSCVSSRACGWSSGCTPSR